MDMKGKFVKSKLIARDYKEELASIAEAKGFSQQAENLLLSMVYKIEDSYSNYKNVKREVPDKDEFIATIVNDVKLHCQDIVIAEPRSALEKELNESKVKIMSEDDAKTKMKKVITYPNEKNLLYGISKMALPPLLNDMSEEDKAIITTINIGRCISNSEAVRDFSGWNWSIIKNEIESSECNIVYILLSYLLGHEVLYNASADKIKKYIPYELYEEIKKVSLQFYMSYDKEQNEKILKKLSDYKIKLEKMKNQSEYVKEITELKKKKLIEIRNIDEILNNPGLLKQQYIKYNNKLPNEKKVFSVSHYADKLQKMRGSLLKQIDACNRMQNPNEFVKEKTKLKYEIKLYEGKTDISKLQKEFLKCFEQRINNANDRREIQDLVYEIRYLNFLPNCKMNLNDLEEKIIPKAIKHRIIAPVSNNDLIDYRILKGIFDTQVVSMENLYIRLSSANNQIHVEIFDGDMLENSYDVSLPEGSSIEIRKTRRMRIFS